MKQIFLSYQYERDYALASLVRQRLAETSDCRLLESTDSELGYEFTSQVWSQIQRANLVVALYSSSSANVLLETGIAIAAGKTVLIVGKEPESLLQELRLLPFLLVSGDLEFDASSIVERVRSINVREDRPFMIHATVKEKLETYFSDPAFFDSIPPSEFEDLVFEWFRENGFEPQKPKSKAEYHGIDITARSPITGINIVIEVKKLSRQSRASMRDLMTILGSASVYRADTAVIITSSSYTAAALKMASESNQPKLLLWTIEDLLRVPLRSDF